MPPAVPVPPPVAWVGAVVPHAVKKTQAATHVALKVVFMKAPNRPSVASVLALPTQTQAGGRPSSWVTRSRSLALSRTLPPVDGSTITTTASPSATNFFCACDTAR